MQNNLDLLINIIYLYIKFTRYILKKCGEWNKYQNKLIYTCIVRKLNSSFYN